MPFPVKAGRGPESESPPEPKAVRDPDTMKEGAPFTPAEDELVLEPVTKKFRPEFHSVQARVVYIGANVNMSVYMPGSLDMRVDDDGNTLWVPSGEGATTYDFRRIDSKGRLIKERLTSDKKVWCLCRNIAHLVEFLNRTDAEGSHVFEIRAEQKYYERIRQYARAAAARRSKTTEEGPALLEAMGLQ